MIVYNIIIIVLGILITYYLYQIPREEAKEKELKREQPVIVELSPKGTKACPIKCKINEGTYFRVLGYSDYKKKNFIELEGSNIRWFSYIYPNSGWEKDFGTDNIYYAPNKSGYYEIRISYKDKNINTSSKVKILTEA